jgi:hypothetical protein
LLVVGTWTRCLIVDTGASKVIGVVKDSVRGRDWKLDFRVSDQESPLFGWASYVFVETQISYDFQDVHRECKRLT